MRQWIGSIDRIAIAIIIAALLVLSPWMPAIATAATLLLPPGTIIVLAIQAALLLLALIWWLWWRLPQRQVARLALRIRDAKTRVDIEDNFRKTIGQALGGAAVLIGAVAAYLQFTQQQHAAHDLLISNQVAKGFEQLASDKMVMRLGGIYALEGVMNTSADYHQPVLEALCAFVRDSTIGMIVGKEPTTDIQAVLTVIGRRAAGLGDIDLAMANLPGAILRDAHLGGAFLRGAHLEGAILVYAHLEGAILDGAYLGGAHLESAILTRATLADAQLTRATLTRATVTQAQLDQACGVDATLPAGLTLRPCPAPR